MTLGARRAYGPGVRRYSILQALPLSFFSRGLYRDVARSWRGIGLAYLLLVVALLTLVIVVRMQVGLDGWVRRQARDVADQVPTIVIRHQVVRVDAAMPCIIRDRRTGAAFAIVDTTGQVVSLDGQQARVLLTRDHLLLRKSAAETRVFDLSRIEDFTLDAARARRWLGLFATWASPVAAPFVFVGLLCVRLVQQLVLAGIGLLVGSLARVGLDFAAHMRLAAVALTPALVLEPVLELLHARPPGWGLLWSAIALGYLVWAVLANRAGPAEAATGPPAAPQAQG